MRGAKTLSAIADAQGRKGKQIKEVELCQNCGGDFPKSKSFMALKIVIKVSEKSREEAKALACVGVS